jgi:hypothetical protein
MATNGEVMETGDRMCFSVKSRSHPDSPPYRVDLLAYGGAGQCHCKDWQTRRWPAIRDGKPKWTRATTCYHVRVAGKHFFVGLIEAMAQDEEKKTPEATADFRG